MYFLYSFSSFLFLLFIIILFSESLWLANLRRPAHDTLLALPQKMWVSGLVHSGDWPLWMASVRYGFPVFNLYFASGFIAPSAVLFGWLFSYDGGIYRIESLTWQLLGACGAYLLARHHVSRPLVAVTIAVSFITSGVVWKAGLAGTVQTGYMGLPWALLGITYAVDASTWRERCLAVAVLAGSYLWILTSGYPPTWLSLPVFGCIYASVLSATSVRRFVSTAVICGIGFCLSLLVLMPIVVETVSTPLFSGSIRPTIDPNEGSVPLSSLFGRFLVNPTYTPGAIQASAYPTYIGFVAGLVLIWRVTCQFGRHIQRYRSLILGVSATLMTLSTQPANPSGPLSEKVDGSWFVVVTSGVNGFAVNGASLATAGLYLLIIGLTPSLALRFQRNEIALLALSISVWICASTNPIGELIRMQIPPFIWSRWSYYYLGIAVLSDIFLSWITIEKILNNNNIEKLSALQWKKNLSSSIRVVIIAVITCCALTTPVEELAFVSGSETPRIGVVSLAWSGGTLILLNYFFVRYIVFKNKYIFVLLPILAYGLLTLTAGTWLARDEALVHRYLPLPGRGTLVTDAVHLVVVGFCVIGTVRLRSSEAVLAGLAVITMFDMVAAKPRYLADVDMVVGEQPYYNIGHMPAFDYFGTQRDAERGAYLHAGTASGRPGGVAWPLLVPQSAAFERAFGNPPLFDQFVHFPSAWTTAFPGSASFTPESLGRPANPELARLVGPTATPDCPASVTPSDPRPSAMVTRLLSSYVQVTYDTACTRLLAYSDTWAQGWTATIDGTPTPVLHLNGAIRGVIAPAGPHILEWNYRPAYWNVTKWVSLGALVITLVCLAWGLWPVRMRRQSPAPFVQGAAQGPS